MIGARFRPTRRPAERRAFCRGCDQPIEKGQEMVSWFTFRNRGQNIHICIPCCEAIGGLA
jgi:hypothetical protein